MNRWVWWCLYPGAGVVVGIALFCADRRRGAQGALAAWILCGVPLIVVRVATALGIRKTSVKRGLIVLPSGMLLRLLWTLGGAAVLYHHAKEWLGVGLWPAVLVFYQVALAVQTRRAIDRSVN